MPPADFQSDELQVPDKAPDGELLETDGALCRVEVEAAYAALLVRDQTILVLAFAGIAGVIAAMLAVGAAGQLASPAWLVAGVIAAIYFCTAFLSSLMVFQSNAEFLMKLARSEPEGSEGERLRLLRQEASDALALGSLSAVIMGIIVTGSS